MAKVGKKAKNTLIYWFVVYLIIWIRLVPRETAFVVIRKLGILAFYLLRAEREKAIKNLSLAFGNEKRETEIRNMAQQVFVDLGYNAVDALRLSNIKHNHLDQLVDFEGEENIRKALDAGKGVILVTGHIGCWELMAAAIAMKGFPLYVVGKPLYDPRLDRILVNSREAAGYHNIPRGESTKNILKALRGNAILGILIDQDTKVDGVFVEFFGKLAFTPVGPVALSLKTGARIVPLAIQMMKNFKHRIFVKKPMELTRTGDKKKDLVVNTQRLSDFLEETIRSSPTQWVWMHERWKTQPENLS